MGMKLPMGKITFTERRAVPTHRIGKRCFEKIIVTREEATENVAEGIALHIVEIREAGHPTGRKQQCFKWPTAQSGTTASQCSLETTIRSPDFLLTPRVIHQER